MAAPHRPADVVVIGAGAIGSAIAWRAGAHGLSVNLVDDRPARGASWAAAGMLAPVTEAHFGEEDLLALNLASRERWPTFAAELAEAAGEPTGFHRSGTVVVARDRDDRAEIDRLRDFLHRLDLRAEVLTSRELRRLEPALAPTTRGGLLVPDDHQLDNRQLLVALAAACERVGVRPIRQRAARILSEGGRVTGVELADGASVHADAVVVAAGAWSAELAGLPEPLPVRPVKGQLLHLRTRPATQGPAPLATHVIRGLDVYVVPRPDGRLVIGATVEERGHDTEVTAGGVLDLLRHAYELLPGIVDCELTETVAGARPGTPDNAPLLGAGPLRDLWIATGHFRNGLLLTPVTADVITAALVQGELPAVADAFDPGRFSRGRAPAATRDDPSLTAGAAR